jgi:hypothetical protein
MNKISKLALALLLVALPIGVFAAGSHTTKCYADTSGARYVADSGCTIKVLSGGTLTVDSGATVNNNGTAKLNGNTLSASAGTATITIPNTTDTLVNLTGAQTLTNKTLKVDTTSLVDPTDTTKVIAFTASGNTTGKTATIASAVTNNRTITLPDATGTLALSNGQAPVACGSSCTLGAANAPVYTLLNQAAGSTATLPAATGTGATYRMVITVANSSNAEKVLTNPITDTIIGTAQGENAGTAKVFVGNASTYHSIQMPFAGTQPSGGFVGDEIVCTDIASATWLCNIKYQAGTTPTTPYSASTS